MKKLDTRDAMQRVVRLRMRGEETDEMSEWRVRLQKRSTRR